MEMAINLAGTVGCVFFAGLLVIDDECRMERNKARCIGGWLQAHCIAWWMCISLGWLRRGVLGGKMEICLFKAILGYLQPATGDPLQCPNIKWVSNVIHIVSNKVPI